MIRSNRKDYLSTQIQKYYFLAKGRNGSPRLAMDLKVAGISVSRTTVATYMRMLGIRSRIGRRFKVTTNSNHSFNIAPNLLNREFSLTEASKVWVGDITYIHTKDGFLYLTTVIDLYDRKVIGWSISSKLKAENTTIAALRMALKRRTPKEGMIFYSDRGVQYACTDFIKVLNEYNVVQSMSRKGNCWDNVVAKSFFKTLKCELIYGNKLISSGQMEIELFEYIEVWYNKSRRHSALGNLTMDEFWNKVKLIDNYKNVA